MEQSHSWEATGPNLNKKFLAVYGAWRFITAFTTARHLSLSWAIINSEYAPNPPLLEDAF